MKLVISESQLRTLHKSLVEESTASSVPEFEAKWSKVNDLNDTSNYGFGKGVSQNESVAMEKSHNMATIALANKLKKRQNTSSVNLSTRTVEQKTFTNQKGEYIHYIVLELN